MHIGVIADDVTGATDLASVLQKSGYDVVLTLGLPRIAAPDADAIVVATKARMLAADEARAIARSAADFLTKAGAEQLYFKYCSTFDSTQKGNIGPIIQELLAYTGESFTVACPSYPQLARTVYQGHLFVGAQLVSDSPMRHHPLTPMTDPDLVRFLHAQGGLSVGLLPLSDVDAGPASARDELARLKADGQQVAILDAVLDRHVAILGEACANMPLVTGGAAFAGALARARPAAKGGRGVAPHSSSSGPVALLSGSCSAATLEQVKRAAGVFPAYQVDPALLAKDDGELQRILDWSAQQGAKGSFLIYSTADTSAVRKSQSQLGRDKAAELLENAFGDIAAGLATSGVRTFVVAGGETSGAVMRSLDVRMMSIGDEIDPGVPWTYSLDPPGFRLALKSGNFGKPDFFIRAVAEATRCG